jgi:hypothetical protein
LAPLYVTATHLPSNDFCDFFEKLRKLQNGLTKWKQYSIFNPTRGGFMKKLVVVLAVGVMSVSVFAMSKSPAEAKAPADAKACAVKDACCTPDGSCKMGNQKAACPACKTAGGTCSVCKAKADATKAAAGAEKAVKDAGCTGGVCPLKK